MTHTEVLSREISGFTGISGDLEQASSALREFLESLPLNEDSESASRLVLAVISTHLQRSFGQESRSAGLLKVYDHLVENWITSLPLKVTGPARHSKFKIIRQVAVELSLGSLTISIQKKASDVKALPGEHSDPDLELRLQLLDQDDGTTRESSPAFYSSQLRDMSERGLDFRLPTPARTPSIYSHTTSTSEVKEDPATSRLRQYALSIKSKPDLGKVSFLSHWPSIPGIDPATYSYDSIQKAAAAEESGGESEAQGRREAARPRRRTEKFLQQSAQVAEPSSQPMVLRSSPEPGVSHPPLMVDDLPMTQPDRGAFGSRPVQQSKKQKKRTAGFR
jgi:RNA polymerase I-specific transcription initiation factor RRN6